MLAPYGEAESDNHAALGDVLQSQFGIVLSLEDFCRRSEDHPGIVFIRGLNLAQVRGSDRLLLISCNYSLNGKEASELPFSLEPESVTFHLIECT